MQRYKFVANAIGLSVLAAEVVVAMSVVSHLTCPNCAYPGVSLRWSGRAIVFLITYSVLSVVAIYLWQRETIRTHVHWLGFIVLCAVLVLIDPIGWRGWIRGGGVIGIIVGIASLARSLAMKSNRHQQEPSHSAHDTQRTFS